MSFCEGDIRGAECCQHPVVIRILGEEPLAGYGAGRRGRTGYDLQGWRLLA